ncbi:MAG TPA: hypothetical protein VM734_31500 [Kofleriaceae bacterium]|nr:hypothetical protein [Kofleriaceae bacterium]
MPHLPRLHVLPLLLAVSLGAACTDAADDPPKLVSVANQTSAAHTVTFGATSFGLVPASTMSAYLEVTDGEQAVLVDGREVWRDSLGSDNVGGSWTLYLQSAGGQLIVGVSADD